LAFGSRVYPSIDAAKRLYDEHQIAVRVVNMRFVKPLDGEMLRQCAEHSNLIVTVEEHAVMAGAGSAVNEWLAEQQYQISVLNIGLPDEFLAQATHEQMLESVGLDANGIYRQILRRITGVSVL
jgi:1-deoxy-D-xylulose-5-phosphate synthase